MQLSGVFDKLKDRRRFILEADMAQVVGTV